MSMKKRGWANPPKEVEPTTEGQCPYCHKHVKALEAHIEAKHKGQKLMKR